MGRRAKLAVKRERENEEREEKGRDDEEESSAQFLAPFSFQALGAWDGSMALWTFGL